MLFGIVFITLVKLKCQSNKITTYLFSSESIPPQSHLWETLRRQNGFTADEFANHTAIYLTDFYLDQETTSSQCYEIAMNELRGGWNISAMTPQKVSELDLNSINAAITKYTDVIRWIYLGSSDEVLTSDFIQPKVIISNANNK